MNSSLCVAPINKYGNSRRGVNWNKTRVNNIHEITRPAYRAGTTKTVNTSVSMPPQIRRGLGNRNITRINFTAPEVRPRDPVDFDKINAINLEQFGQKIQLSDKTIDDLIRVNVKDPTDYAWIAEKARLEAAGSDALPFGRKQREIQKRVNFGKASLNINENLAVIKATVEAGRTENLEERRRLGLQLSSALTNLDDVKKLNEKQFNLIIEAVRKLKIPKNYRSAGFTHRLWTGDQFKAEKGAISMFILANIKSDRSINEPLLSRNKASGEYVPASLLQAYQMNVGKNRRVLDIQNAVIIDYDYAEKLVLNEGVDDGMLDGVLIKGEEKKDDGTEAPFNAVDYLTPEFKAVYPELTEEQWEEAMSAFTAPELIIAYQEQGLTPPVELMSLMEIIEI